MNWDAIAPMFVAVVFILVVGAVVLLRPLVTRLAPLLDVMTREKAAGIGGGGEEVRALRESLDRVIERLDLVEERQAFTERLLEGGAAAKPLRPGSPAE